MTEDEKKAMEERIQAIGQALIEPVVEEIAKILSGQRVIAVVPVVEKGATRRFELHIVNGPEYEEPWVRRVKEAIKAVKEHHGFNAAQKTIWRHAGAGARLADLVAQPDLFEAVLKDCAEQIEQEAEWKLTPEELEAL